jgi:alkanesulfonate monooxygenase SsuD/methylene tetrahydromethanopterin reductase-like flavin-dependent oxidoreductase (luciferase family)
MPNTISIPASWRTRATSTLAGISSVSIGSIVIALPSLFAARPSLHPRRSEDNVPGTERGGEMKLSLIIRGQHPAGEDMRARLADDIDLVMRAEQLGFDALVKGSHYSAHPLQSLQQIPFLAHAAVLAPRLRLVCGLVLLPLHKPLDIAEQLATLDVMCGGKLVFGCGIGYRDVEFKAFGVTRREAAARFEECLLAVKRLWTEDFVDMTGSHFELDHANCTVKPLQKPMPPIWIGANADVAIRRAARLGDCWYINPHSTLTTLARQMDVYRRALDQCGKPFPAELPMRREVFVARTRAEAIRLARPSLEVKYKTYREWGQDKVMPAGDDFDHGFEELLEDRFLIGSPAEVAERLIDLKARFGVNHLVASVHWPGMPNRLALEQMQILAEEVMPAVRRAA